MVPTPDFTTDYSVPLFQLSITDNLGFDFIFIIHPENNRI
jgi:hypothetical protein